MTILRRYSTPLVLLLCAGCGGPQGDPRFETDRQSADEAEANLAALRELVTRNRERAATEPDPDAPADLEVVVMEPSRPATLSEDGALLRSALDAFREGGPHAVLSAATLEPARDGGGSPIGFRIETLHPGSDFITAAGLGVGDVVSTVNGHSILMPDGFIDAWDSLEDADSLTIEVVRGGTPETLTWPIEDDGAAEP